MIRATINPQAIQHHHELPQGPDGQVHHDRHGNLVHFDKHDNPIQNNRHGDPIRHHHHHLHATSRPGGSPVPQPGVNNDEALLASIKDV